jgi:hypothetical protein
VRAPQASEPECRGGVGYRPAGKLSRDNPAQLVNSLVNCAIGAVFCQFGTLSACFFRVFSA